MHVAVVGGGVAGLTAAWTLARAGVDVTVLEGSDRVGGKLRAERVGDLVVDVGSESVLARRPEAVDLMHELGLADAVVHPAPAGAAVWTRGAVRPLPRTVMGVPGDVEALVASGIVADPPVGRDVPLGDADESVRDFLVPRVGAEVVDRLVEPLLGGVYAGHASRLSLRAAAPQVLALGSDPLVAAARSVAASTQTTGGSPVFAGLEGGVSRLADALEAGVLEQGGTIRTGCPVRAVEPEAAGAWRLVLGPVGALEELVVDAVVVATPPPASGRLLTAAAPAAAFALAGVEMASLAIVTFALDAPLPLEGSGFLVPPVDGTTIKAATFSSQKWPWLADRAGSGSVVRTSVGRAGETEVLQRPDEAVVEAALTDLRAALGEVPRVVASHVQRWGGALPQYEVGHLDLVARVRADVAQVDGLEVCGAAYDGVGIPAVVASARAAAHRVLERGTMDA